MVERIEQQDFPDNIKGSDVDVFRDTALRYLGEHCIHCKIIMTIVRPAVDLLLQCMHKLCPMRLLSCYFQM